MQKTKWDDSFILGLDIIDNEHKILFDLAKDLGNTVKFQTDNRIISTMFSVIIDYFHQHFEREEELLEDKEGYLEHCLEHYKLIRDIHKYIVDFRNNRSVDIPPGEYLEEWLLRHINEVDKPVLAVPEEKAENGSTIDSISAFVSSEEDEIITSDPADKRKHKRIGYEKLLDNEILGSCYNTNSMKNSAIQIEDLSAGGLRIVSKQTHAIGDLLIINCSVGKIFKMKEKVKVRNNFSEDEYGVEFISPKQETVDFLTQLCGAAATYR